MWAPASKKIHHFMQLLLLEARILYGCLHRWEKEWRIMEIWSLLIENKRLATITIYCTGNKNINMQQKVHKIRIMPTTEREIEKARNARNDNGRGRMRHKQNRRQFKFVPIINGEIWIFNDLKLFIIASHIHKLCLTLRFPYIHMYAVFPFRQVFSPYFLHKSFSQNDFSKRLTTKCTLSIGFGSQPGEWMGLKKEMRF